MKMTKAVVLGLVIAGLGTAFHLQQSKVSPYAGQEDREIKSLSNEDVAELRRGGGWGLAKAAELNGVPGPIHLLEMKDKIGLNAEQVEKITAVYESMRGRAKELGEQLIEQEKELESKFRDKTISESDLRAMLTEIANTRSELRFVHLAAHLETPTIVAPEQISHYNRLRGYGSGDPCANVPEGHNEAMWRKHNGCG